MTRSEELAAQRLIAAAENRDACPPIRELIGETDLASAYRIQDYITNFRVERGAKVVGRKIGLTSFAVQKQLGVDQPDYGTLFAHRQIEDGGTLDFSETMQPKIEAEIALILKNDLTQKLSSPEALIPAVASAHACLELVGSRVAGWNIRITDTIADNASASHFVLGKNGVDIEQIDMVHCKMKMTQNDQVVSEGTGAACMGSPLLAAVWLVNTMIDHGTPLRAGEIVLTGALGPVCNVMPGDHFEASIEGLGTVSVSFGD